MFRRSAAALAFVLAASFYVVASAANRSTPQAKAPAHEHDEASHDASQPGGWTLPPDAQQKKSPLTADAKVLAGWKVDLQEQVPEVPRSRAGSVTGPTLIRITQRTWI